MEILNDFMFGKCLESEQNARMQLIYEYKTKSNQKYEPLGQKMRQFIEKVVEMKESANEQLVGIMTSS